MSTSDDLGAREFSSSNRWFSWLGLVVGLGLLMVGLAMAVSSVRDVLTMPDAPVECAAQDCPMDQWVRITDPEWSCGTATASTPAWNFLPAPAPGVPELHVAIQLEEPCDSQSTVLEGMLRMSGSRLSLTKAVGHPVPVLWIGHGRGNSLGLIVVGAMFAGFGVLCLWFYSGVLSAPGREDRE